MTTTQVVVIAAAVVIVAIIVSGRKLTVTFRDVKATVEKTSSAVGEKNGNDLTVLGELAEIRAEQEAVKAKLDERTHVTREGRHEPEDLAGYTQDRMHDLLAAVALVALKVDVMWKFLKPDYDLPDLPSMHKEAP